MGQTSHALVRKGRVETKQKQDERRHCSSQGWEEVREETPGPAPARDVG